MRLGPETKKVVGQDLAFLADQAIVPQDLLLRLAGDVRQSLHHVIELIELAEDQPLPESQSRCLSGCRSAADELLDITGDLADLYCATGPLAEKHQ